MDDAGRLLARISPTISWRGFSSGFAAETISPDVLDRLPPDYLALLKTLGGGEGFLGDSFLRLYSLDESAAANREYHVTEFLPGCYLFGSDGCGNAYLFDLQKPEILFVSFIPLDRRLARSMGSDFSGFLESLSRLPPGSRSPMPANANPDLDGKEIHEIHPVVLGGDPVNLANKVFITPPQHAKASTFFNRLVREMRAQQET